jgi:hypothetical protein
MWRLRRLIAKLHNFFHRKRAEQELEREIASHLAMLEEDFQRRGMTADEAWLAARRAYGGVAQAKNCIETNAPFCGWNRLGRICGTRLEASPRVRVSPLSP